MCAVRHLSCRWDIGDQDPETAKSSFLLLRGVELPVFWKLSGWLLSCVSGGCIGSSKQA